MITYLFGFGDHRWTVEAETPVLARIAIHEYINPQAGKERPAMIYAMNDMPLDEERIVYYPTPDARNNLVKCDYAKFCADHREEIKTIMSTIKKA